MKINPTWLWRLGQGLGLTLPLVGCPSDDTPPSDGGSSSSSGSTPMTDSSSGVVADSSSGGGSSSEGSSGEGSSSTTDGPMMCLGVGGPNADGDACTANSDCASGVCTIYTDAPVNDDAVCEASAEDCSTRITGTIFDFGNPAETVEAAELLVAPALSAALNPTGVTEATALVAATSDADGRFDGISSGPIVNVPLGIVGLVSAPGFFLTITGVAGDADGAYEVANAVHDMWAIPQSDLSNWSDSLAGDIPEEFLPLGEQGGVVGLIRDASGAPIAGATVESEDGADSDAFIRYLNDDGTFGMTETSDLGVFLIIAPGSPSENFDAIVDGMEVPGGPVGSAAGAVFTLIITQD